MSLLMQWRTDFLTRSKWFFLCFGMRLYDIIVNQSLFKPPSPHTHHTLNSDGFGCCPFEGSGSVVCWWFIVYCCSPCFVGCFAWSLYLVSFLVMQSRELVLHINCLLMSCDLAFSPTRSGFLLFLPMWDIHIITLVTWSDGSDHVEWLRQERSDHTRRCRVWSGRSWRSHETILGKPRDANRWSSERIVLSQPHTHDGFLLSVFLPHGPVGQS